MESHSFLDREVVVIGNSRLFQIVDFIAMTASAWEILPLRMESANCIAFSCNLANWRVSDPSGANQVPRVSFAWPGSSLWSVVIISKSSSTYSKPGISLMDLYSQRWFVHVKSIPYQKVLFLST